MLKTATTGSMSARRCYGIGRIIAGTASEGGQRTVSLPADTSASGLELCDDCRDVVVLFLKTESTNTIHECG